MPVLGVAQPDGDGIRRRSGKGGRCAERGDKYHFHAAIIAKTRRRSHPPIGGRIFTSET